MSTVSDVFLSHNSKDKPKVREIATALENSGFKVWLDEWELIPGQPWIDAIEEGLRNTNSIAVFIGASGLGKWERPEMRAALSESVDRGAAVIPVLLPDGPEPSGLPTFLKTYTCVDMRAGVTNESLCRLQSGIQRIPPRFGRNRRGDGIISDSGDVLVVESSREVKKGGREDRVALGQNPYMGVSAFHEADADRFFGRDEQIKDLQDRFHELHEIPPSEDSALRLLTVYGPSGSGKSSVVRAGLIPQLAKQPLAGYKSARVAVVTPGSHPLESLAAVLARLATDDDVPAAKSREFSGELKLANSERRFDGLRRIAAMLPDIESSPLVVLVDQFEELYSLGKRKSNGSVTERDIFIDNLLVAASDASKRVSIILTLRSDFLGETQSNDELNTAVSRQGYLVPAMTENQLRRAITQPAINAGQPIDTATVNLLVAETSGRAGALPLLQFALTRIWEGIVRNVEPAVTLKQIGGVGGALAGEAQQIFDRLSTANQVIARRVFLELIQLGEGTRDTRRRVSIDSLIASETDEERVGRVIDGFSQPTARLVTLSGTYDGTDLVEVTHESLIDNWALLKDWLEEDREDIRFQRMLNEVAVSWAEQGKPEGSLWRPPDLDRLRKFSDRCQSGESQLQLTRVQTEFYNASTLAEKKRIDFLRSQKAKLKFRLRTATTAAIVAGLLLVVAIGLAIANYSIAQSESAAKDLARRRLTASRQSFDEWLYRVSGDIENYPGLSQLRLENLTKARSQLEEWTSEKFDPSEAHERARWNHRLGEVYTQLGRLEKNPRQRKLYQNAQSQFTKAIEVFGSSDTKSDRLDAAKSQIGLAIAFLHMFEASRDRAHAVKAHDGFGNALSITGKVVTTAAAGEDWLSANARAKHGLARLHNVARFDDETRRRDPLQLVREVRDEFSAILDRQTKYRQMWLSASQDHFKMLLESKDGLPSEQTLEEDINGITRLMKKHPGHLGYLLTRIRMREEWVTKLDGLNNPDLYDKMASLAEQIVDDYTRLAQENLSNRAYNYYVQCLRGSDTTQEELKRLHQLAQRAYDEYHALSRIGPTYQTRRDVAKEERDQLEKLLAQ